MQASPAIDVWLGALVLLLIAASVATWLVVAARGRPWLRYEARRPVPWGAAGGVLAGFFVANVLASAFFQGGAGNELRPGSLLEFAELLLGDIAFKGALVGLALAAVVIFAGATRTDLGLPEFVAEIPRDVGLGVVVCLAAVAPVYGTQLVLVALLGEPEGHPLLRMLAQVPNPALLLLAFAVAVIVAPICEEIIFRLLLQGWLERWEDERLGWRRAPAGNTAHPDSAATASGDAAVVSANVPAAPADAGIEPTARTPADAPDQPPVEPPQRGVAGLPYGWMPIVTSSALFGLAHVGYGPDPIPIFLLAIGLGFAYQRTHRILPCIVAHAMFNSISVVALWRMLQIPLE